jgi:hypothetical protein
MLRQIGRLGTLPRIALWPKMGEEIAACCTCALKQQQKLEVLPCK